MAGMQIRFSLQGMLLFLVAGAAMLNINLRPAVSSGEVFLSIALPPGESNLRDWMMIERGSPFSYQYYRIGVEHGTATAIIRNGWPRTEEIPFVTHAHWLVVDIVCAVSVAAVCGWMLPRIATMRIARRPVSVPPRLAMRRVLP